LGAGRWIGPIAKPKQVAVVVQAPGPLILVKIVLKRPAARRCWARPEITAECRVAGSNRRQRLFS
jgi:hypothetical protein